MTASLSRTHPSIPVVLNDALIWTFFILPLISSSSIPLSKPLRMVPNTPTTINITVTLIFHNFFGSLNLLSCGCKIHKTASFFLVSRFGLLARIKWSVFSQNTWESYESHSLGWILVCAYTIGQNSISYTIPPFPSSHDWSCTPLVLVYFLNKLYNELFHLLFHIIYTCHFFYAILISALT